MLAERKGGLERDVGDGNEPYDRINILEQSVHDLPSDHLRGRPLDYCFKQTQTWMYIYVWKGVL